MSAVNVWRKYAGPKLSQRPKCALCREPQSLLIVGGHTLPPGKWGSARGVKRLGLCRRCIFALAGEASLLESQVVSRT